MQKPQAEMCDLLQPMTGSAPLVTGSDHLNGFDLISKGKATGARLARMMASGKRPSKAAIVWRKESNPFHSRKHFPSNNHTNLFSFMGHLGSVYIADAHPM